MDWLLDTACTHPGSAEQAAVHGLLLKVLSDGEALASLPPVQLDSELFHDGGSYWQAVRLATAAVGVPVPAGHLVVSWAERTAV